MLTILGGGPAGLAVAFYAHRAGIPCVVYEKSDAVGGLCRTYRVGAHRYDSGAHRFHDRDPEITRDLKELLGDQLLVVRAPSRIYTGRHFVDFPPTPLNFILSSGPREVGRIGLDLLRARRTDRVPENFEDFAVAQFGKILARRFLLNYSEKLWGLPGSQLSADISTRRLRGMNIRGLLAELMFPKKKATHIDGQFLYPQLGYGQIAEALAADLPRDAVRTGHEVTRLECRDGRVRCVHFRTGAPARIEGPIVSTMPLTRLVQVLGEALDPEVHSAASKLCFRTVRLIFLRLAQASLSPNASIYLPDPALCVSRVFEPKNRSVSMAPADETSLVAEVPCCEGDILFQTPPEELKDRVVGELREVGLLDPASVLEWRHHLLPDAYPVYSVDYAQWVQLILTGFQVVGNLDTIGRNGLYFYSHLHDQLRMGKDYVQNLRGAATSLSGAGGRRDGDEGSVPDLR